MRGEVDDQQPPARRHQPRGLGHRRRRLGEIVQHLVHDHQVGLAVGQARGEDVAVAQLALWPGPPGPSGRGRC